MSAYSKEPWIGMEDGTFNPDHDWSAESDSANCSSSATIWADGEVVALVVLGRDDDEKLKANARRIVACVNACAGLDSDLLENILMLGDTLKNRFDALRKEAAQRDELLAALTGFMNIYFPVGTPVTSISAKARAAIAKATGEQQ